MIIKIELKKKLIRWPSPTHPNNKQTHTPHMCNRPKYERANLEGVTKTNRSAAKPLQ